MKAISVFSHEPWNKGKLVGQKAPLRIRDIWAIRVKLQLAQKTRDLALFDLAIDSKLRACDLTRLRVRDIAHGEHVSPRAIVMQLKTHRPVQFEITEQTRSAVEAWIRHAKLRSENFLFPSRLVHSEHISTRQYARIVKAWVAAIGSSLVRNSYPAANQGVADLPQDKESQGRTALTGPYEAGKHCQVPWHRGRRRSGDGRADRSLGA